MQKIAIGFNKAGNFLHTLLPCCPFWGFNAPYKKNVQSFFLRMQFKTKFSRVYFEFSALVAATKFT